jgi:hypothetical protein
VKIPGFIAKQFYVAGSLRNAGDGFELKAQNPMGGGVLVGVGRMSVDGQEILPGRVSAQRSDGSAPIKAQEVDKWHPVPIQKGDTVTLHVAGQTLSPGEHRLDVELFELTMGQLSFSISDSVTE